MGKNKELCAFPQYMFGQYVAKRMKTWVQAGYICIMVLIATNVLKRKEKYWEKGAIMEEAVDSMIINLGCTDSSIDKASVKNLIKKVILSERLRNGECHWYKYFVNQFQSY